MLGVQVPVCLGHVRVDGNGISSGDQGLLQSHVFQIATGGTIAQQDTVTIQQSDCGQHEAGQVGQALVNLLVQSITLAAEDAIPVLHAQRDSNQPVMLGNGQIKDFVGFKKRREDRPALEHHTAEIDLAIKLGIGKNHLGALGAGGSLNAGTRESSGGAHCSSHPSQ